MTFRRGEASTSSEAYIYDVFVCEEKFLLPSSQHLYICQNSQPCFLSTLWKLVIKNRLIKRSSSQLSASRIKMANPLQDIEHLKTYVQACIWKIARQDLMIEALRKELNDLRTAQNPNMKPMFVEAPALTKERCMYQ